MKQIPLIHVYYIYCIFTTYTTHVFNSHLYLYFINKGKKAVKVYEYVKHTKKTTSNPRKHFGDVADSEFSKFVHKGDYRLHLPTEVVRRVGLSKNLHSLYVQNMTRVVEVYDVKTELNSCKLQ
ncbi:hypothetical protein Hanom_Chr01g00025341 [Helianthus anomalus]